MPEGELTSFTVYGAYRIAILRVRHSYWGKNKSVYIYIYRSRREYL